MGMNNTYIKRLTAFVCLVFFFTTTALCTTYGPKPRPKHRNKYRITNTSRQPKNLFENRANTRALQTPAVGNKSPISVVKPAPQPLVLQPFGKMESAPNAAQRELAQQSFSKYQENYSTISSKIVNGTFGQPVEEIKLPQPPAFENAEFFEPYLYAGSLAKAAERAAQAWENAPERWVAQGEQAEKLKQQDKVAFARKFREQLEAMGVLTEREQAAIKKSIDQLDDPDLRRRMLANAQAGNVTLMRRDLTEYYDLEKAPTESAYNYVLRTGEPSLLVYKILRSPLVETHLQDTLEQLLALEEFTLRDEVVLLATLEMAYRQIDERTKQAVVVADQYLAQKNLLQEERIKYNQDFVRSVTKRGQEFVKREGRLPATGGMQNKLEHALAEQISWIRFSSPKNFREDAAEEISKLEAFWKQYEKWWTREETLQRYRVWREANPGRIPQSGHYVPNISAEETDLLENLVHWNLLNGIH